MSASLWFAFDAKHQKPDEKGNKIRFMWTVVSIPVLNKEDIFNAKRVSLPKQLCDIGYSSLRNIWQVPEL